MYKMYKIVKICKNLETGVFQVIHIEMPKKGGTGLNEALSEMCVFARMLANKEDTTAFIQEHAY